MPSKLYSDTLARKFHEGMALARYHDRIQARRSTEAEEREDWYLAGFGAESGASLILRIMDSGGLDNGIIVSDAVATELSATDGERCKASVAYEVWNRNGGTVDDNQLRISADWAQACRYIEQALRSPPPPKRHSSVAAWVEEHYNTTHLPDLVKERAYCHSLGSNRAGEQGDYYGAKAYIADLERLLTAAVSPSATNQSYERLVGFLLDSTSRQYVTALELLFPRITEIRPVVTVEVQQAA